MLPMNFIFSFYSLFFFFISVCYSSSLSLNLTLPHQHPYPDSVAQDMERMVNMSITRRKMSSAYLIKDQSNCQTGNPIDDCWRCDANWANNRQRLADCAIGFGQGALGGKGGQYYVVTDSSDQDPLNPKPGTLRFGVIQNEPLWIIFSSNMVIQLQHGLVVNSFKTIDGRGANVGITGNGCITVQHVSNVIIHNIHVYECKPSENTDGDGISIYGSRNIWIDHCDLSHCTDGLIDVTMGSTAVTISNNLFSNHDKVMLLGHDDNYAPDQGMQVTIGFNHFGDGLVQRMPRCRLGYVHVVNNDYTQWKMYAIGGSANPTINSQGNRYIAPPESDAKEVTKRIDTDEGEWSSWNWRSDGDIMENGAFFVPSGGGLAAQYAKASSVEPKSATLVQQLTMNAGVLGAPRDNIHGPDDGPTDGHGPDDGPTDGHIPYGSGGDTDYFGWASGSGVPPKSSTTTLWYLLIISILCISNESWSFVILVFIILAIDTRAVYKNVPLCFCT